MRETEGGVCGGEGGGVGIRGGAGGGVATSEKGG